MVQFLRFSCTLFFLRVEICLAPRRMEKHTKYRNKYNSLVYVSLWLHNFTTLILNVNVFFYLHLYGCSAIVKAFWLRLRVNASILPHTVCVRLIWIFAKRENMQITCEAQTCNIPWFNSIWFRDFFGYFGAQMRAF